jgi:uncharacterized repeat protein (TIGR03803 family)
MWFAERAARKGRMAMQSVRLLLCCVALAGCSRGTIGALPVTANPNLDATTPSHMVQYAGVPFAQQAAADVATFKTLYRFKGTPDGANPSSSLLDVGGTLYGTTVYGGLSNYGTIFKVSKSGAESVLLNCNLQNGSRPSGGLIYVNGLLYGTTWAGGANDYGTVFKITPSGKETVLHRFDSNGSDGYEPSAGLVYVDGTLYGTTSIGGVSGSEGTVFKITPSGTETVLHSFNLNNKDGREPTAGLTYFDGALYGTTLFGGGPDLGTVYKITLSGTEAVLYGFRGQQYLDGMLAASGLINVNGALYGTTVQGGSECPGANGCGTVYKVTPSGVESVVYSWTCPGLVDTQLSLSKTGAGVFNVIETTGSPVVYA